MKIAAARASMLGFVVALMGFLGACQVIGDLPEERAPAHLANPVEGYQLEPGNKVRVTVFNEPNLSGEFTLDATGNIDFPLVGSISANGLTAKALAQRIQELLKKGAYYQDPSVSVEVGTFRPIYVLGEVKQPGEIPFTSGLTVLSAVARAGGYDYRAHTGDVALYRTENGGQKKYRAEELTPLRPGDIVRVLERRY